MGLVNNFNSTSVNSYDVYLKVYILYCISYGICLNSKKLICILNLEAISCFLLIISQYEKVKLYFKPFCFLF
jgi:hypothetical protein